MQNKKQKTRSFITSGLIKTLKENWKWYRPGISKEKILMLGGGMNRAIDSSHVSKLQESIVQLGQVIRPVILARITFITGKPELYIIDGQHLWTAASVLGIDVPYVILGKDITTAKELVSVLAVLNSTSKSWKLATYIDIHSVHSKSYRIFNELFQKYNIERSLLASLLHFGHPTPGTGGSSLIAKIVKDGDLEIKNEQRTRQLLDYILDLRLLMKDRGRINQRLIIASMLKKIILDGGDYNHNQYKSYVTKNIDKIILASNDPNIIQQLLIPKIKSI